jgi:hypothetical protein
LPFGRTTGCRPPPVAGIRQEAQKVAVTCADPFLESFVSPALDFGRGGLGEGTLTSGRP